MATIATPLLPVTKPVPELVNGDALYEVVNGLRVECPPMGVYQNRIAYLLAFYLESFGKLHKLGRAITENLFILDRATGLKRRPDAAFVSYAKWPSQRRFPDAEDWDLVPDLCIEVVSSSNTAKEILAKIREYFQAGTQQVWVVYPTEEQVYVYQSPTQNKILTRNDELDGANILPGFRLPVASLFEGEED